MQLEKCTDFMAGKQNRTSFQARPPIRQKESLELVHTNVCQVNTKSHAGSQYFVKFIDDHNRMLWVSPLKTKDQVLFVSKEFHVRVESETGRKLKAVRVDNGGEYRGQFEEYCRLKGIRLKDARIEWSGRENEPDHHGASPEYVGTCKVVQDVLG